MKKLLNRLFSEKKRQELIIPKTCKELTKKELESIYGGVIISN